MGENRIFGRTLSLILENIENYLLSCYDVVGLLIMIKVCCFVSILFHVVLQRCVISPCFAIRLLESFNDLYWSFESNCLHIFIIFVF